MRAGAMLRMRGLGAGVTMMLHGTAGDRSKFSYTQSARRSQKLIIVEF